MDGMDTQSREWWRSPTPEVGVEAQWSMYEGILYSTRAWRVRYLRTYSYIGSVVSQVNDQLEDDQSGDSTVSRKIKPIRN